MPDFLVAKFKRLERDAYEQRKMGNKTMIRFNDMDMDLQLLVRMPVSQEEDDEAITDVMFQGQTNSADVNKTQ